MMPNFPVKVAVATKDGISINEHFGHTKRFWIYQLDQESCKLVEQRDVENYCLGNSSSQSAMAMILETINDCYAVMTAKIGDGPKDKLAKINVQAVSWYAYEAVEESLVDYAARASIEPDL
ncbi:NifB/NifX family molybdenum-iron cluster-binding protein [Thalassolituus sp.]|jgi:predicted Fe-Mo cluster-binding NifX family protein|uniref:NifB/NifX family molybdenum-iron cluster-binding protein n=1 Tax=Thalassolituus sp. TaxID=2030822 RepID=UPI002A81FA4E|nr:NifB/NifX family molybdenum-iron cluster-binding protein [Thalassolituus sp.]|tara:strand:- start:1682 stop:2044 length:363 start_codon:yes stop_codon:yes gene_type:complete